MLTGQMVALIPNESFLFRARYETSLGSYKLMEILKLTDLALQLPPPSAAAFSSFLQLSSRSRVSILSVLELKKPTLTDKTSHLLD